MTWQLARRAAIVACLVALGVLCARSLSSPTPAPRPRLVVVIVIDQFRYDFLERYGDLFGPGGFARLMRSGGHFTNARYTHVPTYTAPGHSIISTGAQPSSNGIVGNSWYDRESRQVVTSVSDPKTHLLGGRPGMGASPSRLLTDTIGDEMRLSNNFRSRVISISVKDRAAILLGGKLASGAFWYEESSGNFVSSDYYFKTLPGWVERFNRAKPADKFFGALWTKLLPDAAYARSTTDNEPYEQPGEGGSRTFPHDLRRGLKEPGQKFYEAVIRSPYGNSLTLDLARAAVAAEKLGSSGYPDLLCIGLSSNDLVGHAFGPYSQEAEDITVRTDRMISEFLAYLDRRIGINQYLVILTADHGVGPSPEFAEARKLTARRIPPKTIRDAMEQALFGRFGRAGWISAMEGESVYLDHTVIAERKLEVSDVASVAGEAAMKVPGVARYLTRALMNTGASTPDFVARAIANGYHPARSGDLILVLEPFTMQLSSTTAATHGSAYNYDTHVPLIFYGTAVRPGRYARPCGPVDIAPTLAVILGVEFPATAMGHPLHEALR